MERVQRWREPAVVVVVLVVLVRLALVAAAVLGAARAGGSGVPEAAYRAAGQLVDPTPYVVLAALVLACHLRPPTAHARTLAALALGVSGLALLLALGLVVFGSPGADAPLRQLDLADRLAGAVVPLLAVLLLGLLALRAQEVHAEQPALAAPSTEVEPEPAEPPPDPALQPTWAPDTASGAAWTTAGEAASGRPASGWGTPAGTGWEPQPVRPTVPDQPGPDGGDRAPGPDDIGDRSQSRP